MVRPSSLHEVGQGWDRQPISRDWGHLHEMSAKQPDVCYGLACTSGFLMGLLLFSPICLRDAQREARGACLDLQRKGAVIFWCPAGGEVASGFLQVFTGSSELWRQTCLINALQCILHPFRITRVLCLVLWSDTSGPHGVSNLMWLGKQEEEEEGHGWRFSCHPKFHLTYIETLWSQFDATELLGLYLFIHPFELRWTQVLACLLPINMTHPGWETRLDV